MYNTCQKCGKRLTDIESRLRGYGPDCWGEIVSAYSKPQNLPGQMDIFEWQKICLEGNQNGEGKKPDDAWIGCGETSDRQGPE